MTRGSVESLKLHDIFFCLPSIGCQTASRGETLILPSSGYEVLEQEWSASVKLIVEADGVTQNAKM